MTPARMTSVEITNHRRRRPMKSNDVSPWYSRVKTLRRPAGLSVTVIPTSCGGRVQAAGDAEPPGFGEQPVAGDQRHRGTAEEVGDDEVEQRGEAEEEGEASHLADGEHIEQH